MVDFGLLGISLWIALIFMELFLWHSFFRVSSAVFETALSVEPFVRRRHSSFCVLCVNCESFPFCVYKSFDPLRVLFAGRFVTEAFVLFPLFQVYFVVSTSKAYGSVWQLYVARRCLPLLIYSSRWCRYCGFHSCCEAFIWFFIPWTSVDSLYCLWYLCGIVGMVWATYGSHHIVLSSLTLPFC
jgi:hypothetical protein